MLPLIIRWTSRNRSLLSALSHASHFCSCCCFSAEDLVCLKITTAEVNLLIRMQVKMQQNFVLLQLKNPTLLIKADKNKKARQRGWWKYMTVQYPHSHADESSVKQQGNGHRTDRMQVTLISSCRENSIAQISTSFTFLPNEVHVQFFSCNTREDPWQMTRNKNNCLGLPRVANIYISCKARTRKFESSRDTFLTKIPPPASVFLVITSATQILS